MHASAVANDISTILLTQDYMRELANCLLRSKEESSVAGASSSTAGQDSDRMQQLTVEASGLMARMLLDPKMHKTLMHGRLDEGIAAESKLDKAFYTKLVVQSLPRLMSA